MLTVTLCDLNRDLVSAWSAAFSDVDAVKVRLGSILKVEADAVVSPANSFGYMDGGIDLVYSQHFGWHVEDRVRERILNEHDGELLVGDALAVPTDDARLPLLIAAPTMRVPMVVQKRVNCYLAFRAVLRLAKADDRITHIACPGLGTGVGCLPPESCARQMRHAWATIVEGHRHRKGGLAGAVRYEHMALIE